MDFINQYLTFKEYQELGGTIQEVPFNILETEARANIDRYTFNRLKGLKEQTNNTKMCMFNLINLINTFNNDAQNNKNGVSSENIDGYSVSYTQANENVLKAKMSEIKATIYTYLASEKLEDKTPYLYRGV